MMKNANFDKIDGFFKENLSNSHAAYISTMPYGFKINGYTIKKKDDAWQLFDREYKLCGIFYNRKLSILAAIMLIKGNSTEFKTLINVDYSFDLFKTDYRFYQNKAKKYPDNLTYQHRFDRVEKELEILQLQISQIEKSFNLQ